MLTSRWRNLIRHGLFIGTTVSLTAGTAGTASATPCDQLDASEVMFVIGFDFSPKVKLVGGVEVRKCISESSEAMVRLELGGAPARAMFGVRTRPLESDAARDEDLSNAFRMEAGLAIDTHAKFGAHLGVGIGAANKFVAAQMWQPLNSTPERAARGSLVFGFGLPESGPVVAEGRPIVVGGRVLLPRVLRRGNAGCAEDLAVHEHFAGAARHEYSSVWTFLRLAAELAAVGAPAELIAAALDAADDEVRHAEACSGAAGGIALAALPDGAAQARFTVRSPRALEVLAREAWLEGCLNEGAASAEAAFAATEACGDTAALLAVIARDERGHAELAWRVLTWVTSIDPRITERALASCGPEAPMRAADRVDPALVRRGVPSAEAQLAAWESARAAARTRLDQLVA